jgi:predicted RNA binding protein YcfA (HicA-like mRNA interferase family)
MSSSDLIRELLKEGWILDRVSGSHHIYKHPHKAGHLSIPHPRKDLGTGLVRQIRKAAGLTKEAR